MEPEGKVPKTEKDSWGYVPNTNWSAVLLSCLRTLCPCLGLFCSRLLMPAKVLKELSSVTGLILPTSQITLIGLKPLKAKFNAMCFPYRKRTSNCTIHINEAGAAFLDLSVHLLHLCQWSSIFNYRIFHPFLHLL